MRAEKMTTKSQEAFRDAVDQAGRRGNPEVSPEHLLVAMLAQEEGVAAPLLQKAGSDLGALRAALDGARRGLAARQRRRRAGPVAPHARRRRARRTTRPRR